ncbi:MAG: Zn-ribbon domain-containing OB-fold protein [Myxococcota bacterium]
MATRVHAALGLFSEGDEGTRLLGSKCRGCGASYFPRDSVCHNPECDDPFTQEVCFGPTGKIWSCAVQNYQPPAPVVSEEPYQPYAVGMIDLDDGLRVMGRIDVQDPMSVVVGGAVTLVTGRIGADAEGNDVITWMFRPI